MSMKKSMEMFELIFSTSVDERVLEPYKPRLAAFVIDESDKSREFSKIIRSLAIKLGFKIVLIHPPKQDLSDILNILSPYVDSIEGLKEEEKYSRQILEISESHKVDFIALTMPYPKVEEGVRGGTLEVLLKEHRFPLLISNEPNEIKSYGVMIYPNPISEKLIRRSITLASERLDILTPGADDVWESYYESLAEAIGERLECHVIKFHDVGEIEHDLVVYELKNVPAPMPLRKTFFVV